MTSLAWLIPCALLLGLVGLGAFLWALKSGQFEDLEGAAWRALDDEEPGDRLSRHPSDAEGGKGPLDIAAEGGRGPAPSP